MIQEVSTSSKTVQESGNPEIRSSLYQQAALLVKPILQATSPTEQMNALRNLHVSKESVVCQEVAVCLLGSDLCLVDDTAVLEHCGSHAALAAAVQILRDGSNSKPTTTNKPTTIQRCLRICKRVLLNDDSDATLLPWWSNTSVEPWIPVLVSFPLVAANACRAVKRSSSIPSWCLPSKYYARIVRATAIKTFANNNKDALLLQLLVRQLLGRNLGEYVVVGLVASKQPWSVVLSAALPTKEASRLCVSLVQYSVSRNDDNHVIANECLPFLADPAVQEALVRVTILGNSSATSSGSIDLVDCIVRLLVGCGAHKNSDDNDKARENGLFRQVTLVATQWSQASFVQGSDVALHYRVTRFLLESIPRLTIDPLSDMVGALMEGVTERLYSSVSEIRKDGMRVAVAMSQSLGQKVHFDELDEETESHDATFVMEEAAGVSTENDINTQKSSSLNMRKRRNRVRDPDAEYVSDDECSGDSSCVSDGSEDDSVWNEDDFTPYSLDDDEEDLRETPLPLYLTDCLDLLTMSENKENARSGHEAALEALPALVRSRPADLQDIAPNIAVALMHMEDKFNLEGFEGKRFDSMCALTVEEPIAVGQSLIREMFGSTSLLTRLDALKTLGYAAFELAGTQAIQSSKAIKLSTFQRALDGPRVSGKRGAVNGNEFDVDKTRRWGHGKKTSTEVTVSNEFVAIAPVWFYSLVGHFVKTKDDPSLWAGRTGSTLLANLFVTLTVCVELVGRNPAGAVLARDLFDLVWNFLDAEVSEIRKSVLSAVGSALDYLPQEAVLDLAASSKMNGGMLRSLLEMSSNDPEGECRGLASQIVRSFAANLKLMDTPY